MDDLSAQSCVQDRAWKAAVRLAAAILKRDYGHDAIDQARRYLHDAELDEHDQSVRLWKAVIDEVGRERH